MDPTGFAVGDVDRAGPVWLEVSGIDPVNAATRPLTACGAAGCICLTVGTTFLTSDRDRSLATGNSNGLKRRIGPFGWSH